MKKKNRISFSDDDRKVAIYARKSRITHKGDSIGVQFKQSAYQYFLEQDANVYGESSDYDGHSGISVYNRNDQYKIEDDDSTFFNPKFSQGRRNRGVSEWIIAVNTVKEYTKEHEIEVIFNVFKDSDKQIYRELLSADQANQR